MHERGRRRRLDRGNRRRIVPHDRGDDAGVAVAVEGPPARDHFVDDRSAGKDVGPLVRRAAFQLFGRQVLQRPEHGSRAADRRRAGVGIGPTGSRRLRPLLGEAEVEHLDARLRHHDVARLQIAMDESLAVRLVERVGQLHRVGEGLIEWQRSACQTLGERLAFDQFHHEVASGSAGRRVGSTGVTDIVERADMRMIQLRDRAGLAFESLAELRILSQLRRQYLDRDGAPQAGVASLVDLAHPARPDEGLDFVGTEARAGSEHSGSWIIRVT